MTRYLGLACIAVLGASLFAGCSRPIDAIDISESALNFERSTSPRFLEIWNKNPDAGPVTIAVRPTANWIVVDQRDIVSTPPASNAGPFDKQVITVTINRSILSNGRHTGAIRLQSPGVVTKEIPVSVEVTGSTPQGGLKIENVVANYGPPNLLSFTFGLRDQDDAPIVAEPVQIQVTAREANVAVADTSSVQLRRAAARQLRVFLVLDYSQSIQNIPNAIADMQTAVLNTFLPTLNQDAQVGVYEFHVESSAPSLVSNFTVDRNFVRQRINALQGEIGGFVGGSRMFEALYMAASEFDATPNPTEERYIILFSDGFDLSSPPTFNLNSVLQRANQRNIRIFTIGLGNNVNLSPLQNLATQTGGRYFPSQSVQNLQSAFQRIVAELESQYTLRWGTVRSTQFLPSFDITVNGLSATHVAQQSFNPLVHGGNLLRGVLSINASSNATQTTAFLRAQYVPRQINRFRIFVRASTPFTVSKVPTTSDGLVESWNLSTTPDAANGGVWINVQSTGPALPFATFGPLLRFTFNGIVEDEAFPFDQIFVDNAVYANNQFFVVEGYDNIAPGS